jgi:hypothetical protein
VHPFDDSELTTAPVRQRSPFLIPVIATCVVLAIGAVAITVILLGGSGRPSNVDGLGSTPATSPRQPTTGLIDPCLVGIWTVTSSTLRVPLDDGPVVFELTTPASQFVTINGDGTAIDEYHQSRYAGSTGGKSYGMEVAGTVHYAVRTSDGTLSFVSPSASGTITVSIDGKQTNTGPLGVSNDPVSYTCAGDTFTEHNDKADSTFTRRT